MVKLQKNIADAICICDHQKNKNKSSKKIRDKHAKETKQYIGNKNPNVVSVIEIKRNISKKTTTVHKLYKRIDGVLKIIHYHKK
jgi:hypothetical protein